jgi:cob(I)alamin adenosyltransferase
VKIYTKGGDKGETSLYGQTRVSKADPRVDAYGDVDELNACLGAARAAFAQSASAPKAIPCEDLDESLIAIQKDLFALGAMLADPGSRIAARVTKATIGDEQIERLEQTIDRLESELPALRRFILPGGGAAGSLLHVARTVCRRSERKVVSLGDGAADPNVVIYLNRLSDLLFVMARAVNHRAGVPETEW